MKLQFLLGDIYQNQFADLIYSFLEFICFYF